MDGQRSARGASPPEAALLLSCRCFSTVPREPSSHIISLPEALAFLPFTFEHDKGQRGDKGPAPLSRDTVPDSSRQLLSAALRGSS